MPHSVRVNKSTKSDLKVKWSIGIFKLEPNYIHKIKYQLMHINERELTICLKCR